MQFLNETTLEEITGKKVGVILRTNAETMDTMTADTFLNDGNLFIDCIPALRRKYIVAVPDDAFISRADTPDPPWEFGIFLDPHSVVKQAGS